MNQNKAILHWGIQFAAFLAIGSVASAQSALRSPRTASGAGPTSSRANPYLDPSMNPYLNPYLSNTSVSSEAALLYFLAAQRESGGIGSGELSGSRQAQRPTQRAEPAPRTRHHPGEGADRYFQRGPNRPAGAAGSYFQRYGDRFDR